MMIAVFSDVHGNLRALEAVLQHIRRLKPDVIVNLGDCVSGPLWPRETCDLLQSEGLMTVRGNHDRAVGAGRTEEMGSSDLFAHERLTTAQREWLLSLPFALNTGKFRCLHANPRNDTEYLVDEVTADGKLCVASEDQIRARLQSPERPVILCGHSHQPRIVRLGKDAVIINPGSVGCPAYMSSDLPRHASETGAPHARYAVVTLGAGDPRAEFVALEYDWEEAAAMAMTHGRPFWAHALRTGYASPEEPTLPR
jgi:putative phosphoesterase